MKRLGFAQIPVMVVLLLMALAVPVATKLVQNNQDTRNKAAHDCIGEGGMVASGTAGCCDGLTKQNCGGSGSFQYCYCKKPVTNPTATPPFRSCTTWSWVGNVCTSRVYQKASNLACDPSNCTRNDPTPRATVTPVATVAPTMAVGACPASGGIPALANGQTYCESPYLLGSRLWTCTNGKSSVKQNFIVTHNCSDTAPTLSPGGCRYLFAGLSETLTNGESKCYNLLGVNAGSQMIKCTNGSTSVTKTYVASNCVAIVPTVVASIDNYLHNLFSPGCDRASVSAKCSAACAPSALTAAGLLGMTSVCNTTCNAIGNAICTVITTGDCPAIGSIPALKSNQTYCQSPYLLGSRLWTCRNGISRVTQNYYFNRNCGGIQPPVPTSTPTIRPTTIPGRCTLGQKRCNTASSAYETCVLVGTGSSAVTNWEGTYCPYNCNSLGCLPRPQLTITPFVPTVTPGVAKCCPKVNTASAINTCTGASRNACNINSNYCEWTTEDCTVTPPIITIPPQTCCSTCPGGTCNGSKSGDTWLHLDDECSAKCICGDNYHRNENGNYGCGEANPTDRIVTPTPTSAICRVNIAARPTPTVIQGTCSGNRPADVCTTGNMLRVSAQCYNGSWDYDDQICNSEGRVEFCGTRTYCCPRAGGNWTTDMSKCTEACGACTQCPNDPAAKGKGDADCSGAVNINDASIWRAEFISGILGTTSKTTWQSDFDCDGKVTLNDISIWRSNFIKSL